MDKPKKKKKKQLTNEKKQIKIANKQMAKQHNSFLMENAVTLRRDLIDKCLNPGKDINYECGYPDTIDIKCYKDMYEREGLGAKVVSFMPGESWAINPTIQDNEKATESDFDITWKKLEKDFNIYQYCERIDVLSGIGSFGIMLLGINDSKDLKEPVDGINETGEKSGNKKYELLYLRTFDQSLVKVQTSEADKKNPRFGQPTMYSLEFDITNDGTANSTKQTVQVHWSRVIHIADNRDSSETEGRPRQKQVWNRLLDIRKVLSGSGEMFWKGGFPGYSFKVDPDLAADATIDSDAVKQEMQDYSRGLQRYIALTGITVESLDPQVADPKGHLDAQVKYIALSLGVPYRVFIGTEEAKLASSQDMKTHNKRVTKRNKSYVSPLVIRPLIDRLIVFGILPEAEEYFIIWPDLNAPSDEEKAKIGLTKTEAMAKYVAADVAQIMSPKQFFIKILGMTEDEADEINNDADGFNDDSEPEEDITRTKKKKVKSKVKTNKKKRKK